MKKIKTLSLLILIIITVLLSQSIYAQTEKILDYKSDIKIHNDGSMTVEENIKVISTGNEIKRGIYRTFPTKYKDRFGNTVQISFEIVKILKNGKTEPFHTENMSNGVKIYIGESNVFLRPGEYTYTLVYNTNYQIGYFDDFDELYWNVTGVDWGFTIDHAKAVVKLPAGAKIINTAGYTGSKGSKGQNFKSGVDFNGYPWFETTAPLSSYEGLTIAVAFSKGIIPEPSAVEKTMRIASNNRTLFVSFTGLLILLFYYIIAWLFVGKDPAKETIIPQFSPPDGYTPAATRYVMRMGYSDKVFAAAIVNMAVKGYLKIEEYDKQFTLFKTGNNESSLKKGEKQIANKLFRYNNSIELEQTNHTKIRSAITALKKSLKLNFETLNFKQNKKYLIPGILISVLTLVAVILFSSIIPMAAFMAVWLTGWTAGTSALVWGVIKGWKAVFTSKGLDKLKHAGVIATTLFALPFVGGELFGLWAFSTATSPGTAVLLLLIIMVNLIFKDLIKAPTILGRKAMDHIEGFKLYLKVAEEERLKFSFPKPTPQLFEKFLPYAIALDVENEWCKNFDQILTQSTIHNEYSPGWYSGNHISNFNISNLSSSLGSSFSSAISSSSTAPGSSSGSGGGGSSGGGGGGGGGGGW